MDAVQPQAVQPHAVPVPHASVPLGPDVQVVPHGDADVVGVAVLAAGRLGAELDVPVAVARPGTTEPFPTGPRASAVVPVRGPGGATAVHLRLADAADLDLPAAGPGRDQGYVLTVDHGRIDLAAVTPTGLWHAVAHLVRAAEGSRTRADRVAGRPPRLPLGTLRDVPWLPWRGLAVDLETEPLGTDGLLVLLGLMSALRLDVLRLPATELDASAYARLRAAAVASRVELVPGVGPGTSSRPGAVGALVASTRARRVDVGHGTPGVRRRAEEAMAAGAAVLADQSAARALHGLPDVVLTVRDVRAADDVAAVRRAVAAGARVVLGVSRRPGRRPLLDAAVTVDRAVAALGLPPGALLGVEAVPGRPGPALVLDDESRAGTLLPWMTAVAEVGWTSPV